MALQNRNAAIRAFNWRLLDESLDNEHLDGYNEVANVRIDPKAEVPQTRATQTPMQVKSTSKPDEEAMMMGLNQGIHPMTGSL